MRHETTAIRSLTSATSATAWEGIQDWYPKVVQVWGTFVGTWKLMVKYHPSAPFVDLVTGKTAGEAVEIPLPAVAVQLVCTAYTSGTINGVLAGFNRRTE